MVDEREILKQYSYKATSSLVLEQDRASRRDKNAGTGEVAPLKAEELPGRMGDKARRPGEKSTELLERLEKLRQRAGSFVKESGGPKDGNIVQAERSKAKFELAAKYPDVVDVANEFELDAGGGGYVPSTSVSQKAFEALLSFVMSKFGDQPRDFLRSAVDEILAILKNQRLQENERKKLIDEKMAVTMSADEYARLSMLGRQIKDFDVDDLVENGDAIGDTYIDEATHEEGVAVVFNSDDEGEGNASADDEMDEVVDIRDILEDETRAVDAPREDPRALSPIERNVEAQHSSSLIDDWGPRVDGMKSRDQEIEFNPHDVDGYWLQRTLSKYYKDEHDCQRIAEEVLAILSKKEDDRTCENHLALLLEYDKFDFISLVLEHREAIVFCTRLARAKDAAERGRVEVEMYASDIGQKLLRQLRLETEKNSAYGLDTGDDNMVDEEIEGISLEERKPARSELASVSRTPKRVRPKRKFALRMLDLENLAFQKGGRLMSVRDCKLPHGSEHIENKDYEEWHLPAVRAVDQSATSHLTPISSLPIWCQSAFSSTRFLNRMQSAVLPCAFESDENILLCAPTGAGKTNVAVLTILRAIRNSSSLEINSIEDADLNTFKVVYVAPMKALVAEVVENLSKRLDALGLTVRELTGDVNLSLREIAETQVIVTTPEKWDIITRKSGERAFVSLVRLLIIDEIHLLHDERGPVLESIVARTTRSIESMSTTTRVIGLSATLPNYKDVAAFLRVNVESGLFYYDSTHRPCPLQQCYVGITAKKAFKRFQLMNELTYEKVLLQLRSANQVIVFVHSRKETIATCQFLIKKAIDDEVIDQFMKPGGASHEIVQSELPNVNGKDLASVLEHGVATHHAGMTRSDRQLAEALFEDGHIKVLVSTATLAWGVNLPAHAVIIKGTQVYSAEHGRWIELSSMDVMQMMGRAGRPQFDTKGEGYIITTKADVLYYLSLMNQQLPIESQFVSRLVDMVNAEVATGSVSSIEEGASWLCYTYLFVRMLKNPTLYGIPVEELASDPELERRRAELIHAAVTQLHRSGLLHYDRKSGRITTNNLGRVAADYYVSHQTMAVYTEHMKPTTTDIDLLRLFSSSGEFRHMRVREEEKLELARLAERIPIPVKESLDEPTAKANVLLQAYISNISLDGLALRADMAYVTQSAARLARALFQVAVQLKCAPLAEKCLRLCKTVTSRQWASQTPLRQFQRILGDDVLHKIERKDVDFERYYDLSVAELGELLRNPKVGRTVHRLVHTLPRLDLEARVRPMSRSIVEVELTMVPNFRFDRKVHRSGETFWIAVEDADSEVLLHCEPFFLRNSTATVEHHSAEHILNFTVQLSTPQPPQYFIRCTSDRWIVPETVLPISFRDLILPEKFAPHTRLLDMRPLAPEKAFSIGAVDENIDGVMDVLAYREAVAEARDYFNGEVGFFTPMQTQLFPTLYGSDTNVVVATLPNHERFLCVELCLTQLFCRQPTSIAVWVVGRGPVAVEGTCRMIANGVAKHLGLKVGTFLSDRSEDLSLLRAPGTVVVTTTERWDMFSRKWRQKRERKILSRVGLVIVDGIQFVNDPEGKGAAMEIMCSRMRYIAADVTESGGKAFRIAAFGDPIANAKEVGHWLGCPPSAVFSFKPQDVDKSTRFEVVASPQRSGGVRSSPAATLVRPVFTAIQKYADDEGASVLIFVPSRRMARSLALELVGRAAQAGTPKRFSGAVDPSDDAKVEQLSGAMLRECVAFGVAYVHDAMREQDKSLTEEMFRSGMIQVLVATSDYAWQPRPSRAYVTIVAGTSRIDEGALALRRAEYVSADLLRMVCRWKQTDLSGKASAVIITEPALEAHYKLRSLEPLPVESQLRDFLSDHLNAEIVADVIETKQDAVDYLTWTFFYRRLPKNPNYYGLKGLSHLEISNHLSEMVDAALSDLEASKCVAAEGDEDIALGKLNLGIIASHYYIRHATVELFASSLTPKTKLRGLLDVLSLASEFSDLPVRIGDDDSLRQLSKKLPISLEEDGLPSFSSPHVKAHLLLQAQLSREPLSTEMARDQAVALPTAVRLLRAMVDVIASAGWLKPALLAVELTQMLIQAQWDTDSSLMQLPHIGKQLASKLDKEFGVPDIFHFFDMDDETRSKALEGLSNSQVLDIADAYRMLPHLQDFEIESVQEIHDEEGKSMTRLVVLLQRNEEEEEMDTNEIDKVHGGNSGTNVPLVHAPRYPEPKEEGWWIFVGSPKTNSLLTLKHVALKQSATVKLEFSSPLPLGKHVLQFYLRSDSYYFDFDQEHDFEVNVTSNADEELTGRSESEREDEVHVEK